MLALNLSAYSYKWLIAQKDTHVGSFCCLMNKWGLSLATWHTKDTCWFRKNSTFTRSIKCNASVFFTFHALHWTHILRNGNYLCKELLHMKLRVINGRLFICFDQDLPIFCSMISSTDFLTQLPWMRTNFTLLQENMLHLWNKRVLQSIGWWVFGKLNNDLTLRMHCDTSEVLKPFLKVSTLRPTLDPLSVTGYRLLWVGATFWF